MIDLHMHTTYSDGTDSVEEILNNVNKLNLEVISITDHNSCKAYEDLEKPDVRSIYKGCIIVGCEFTTSFDNKLIEVLGYGFDYNKIQNYLDNYYTSEFLENSNKILFERILEKIKKYQLVCDIKKIENLKQHKFYFMKLFNELSKHPENKEILEEDIFSTMNDFYRKGIYNIDSKLFINHVEFKPPLKEIIDLVHSAGGIVFLAHPFQYKFDDIESFLNKIYNENNLDGIECFYTTFNDEQTNYLLDFARRRNLLISGGSAYHGTIKKQHDLGIGSGNLNISKDIITNWSVIPYQITKNNK